MTILVFLYNLNSSQSVLPVLSILLMLSLTFFPALRSHILCLFDLVYQIIIEVDVFDCVTSNEHFLYTVKSSGVLSYKSLTLSLKIDVYIFKFINLSTPFMIPLYVSPDFSYTITLVSFACPSTCRGNYHY